MVTRALSGISTKLYSCTIDPRGSLSATFYVYNFNNHAVDSVGFRLSCDLLFDFSSTKIVNLIQSSYGMISMFGEAGVDSVRQLHQCVLKTYDTFNGETIDELLFACQRQQAIPTTTTVDAVVVSTDTHTRNDLDETLPKNLISSIDTWMLLIIALCVAFLMTFPFIKILFFGKQTIRAIQIADLRQRQLQLQQHQQQQQQLVLQRAPVAPANLDINLQRIHAEDDTEILEVDVPAGTACFVCWINRRKVVFDPCGHTMCCGCAIQCLNTPRRECPQCRAPIRNAIRLYE